MSDDKEETGLVLTIAVDFDGTIVKHDYPRLGSPANGAIKTLIRLQQCGHKLILLTMRSGKELNDAVDYLQSHNIKLYGVNENPG